MHAFGIIFSTSGRARHHAGVLVFRLAAMLGISVLIATPVVGDAWPDDDPPFRFGRLSLEDGLSHNVVYSVLQDRYGFLWLGTEDGLNKYDGHNVVVYRHEPHDSLSLSDNWITALAEDDDGAIWVGTRHGGLNRFDRDSETFERLPFQNCDSAQCLSSDRLNSPYISTLLQSSSGALWVGTFGGLSRLDRNQNQFEHFTHEPGNPRSLSNNRIWCLAEDEEGVLWIGTWSGGLNRLAPDESSITQFRQGHIDGPHIASDRIRSLVVGRNGSLWIGTSGGGLNRFETRTGLVDVYTKGKTGTEGLLDNRIWSLHQDHRGILWIGTYGAGLARFDPQTGKFRHYQHDPDNPNSLSSQIVSTILEDRSGILWLGSDRGASRFNLAQEGHRHYTHEPLDPASLGHPEILSLHESHLDPDVIWVGTNDGGLDRFNIRTSKFEHITSQSPPGYRLSSDVVNDVAEDRSRGQIWLATRGGLNRIDAATLEVSAYRHDPDDLNSLSSDAVISVLVDHENTVWSGTDGGGISRYFPETGRFVRYSHSPFDPTSLSDQSVRTIYQDSRNRVWIGTVDGGLNLFHPESETFTSYRHSPNDSASLWHNRVVTIHEAADGHLWLGTYGGLNRFDPERGEFTRYDEDDGVPTEPYMAIKGDGRGGLWMTASNRLTHFDPIRRTARHYSDRNGLSPNHYSANALVVRSHRDILLGGSNGLSRFSPPAREHDHVKRPPLVVTAFKKMDEIVSQELFSNETITLSHSDRFFTLEFAVLDFTNPEKHQYQFMMEGYDTDWQQIRGSLGRASYANFRPSKTDYVFRIRGANSQGSWNSIGIRVHVVPPWWETLWFRLSAILAIGLVFSSVAWYSYNRRATVRAETLRLLAEGRERERHYLARELHDVPLQNLYSMRHKLEVLGRDPGVDNQHSFKELHDVLEKTAEDLRILCGELRPPSLATFGLEKAIRSHVRTVRRSHPDLTIHLSLSPDGRDLSDHLRHSLFRIYQSALANVLRHAEANTLWVTFDLSDERITLELRDDGCGFQVPRSFLTLARSQHFGLLGISEWAEAIGAELSVESAPGHGTKIRVVASRRHVA